MAPALELVYFAGCPHVDAARRHLHEACRIAGIAPTWTEWDTEDPATPPTRRAFASPTVLLDGMPVGDGGHAERACCVRSGAPTLAQLLDALGSRPEEGRRP